MQVFKLYIIFLTSTIIYFNNRLILTQLLLNISRTELIYTRDKRMMVTVTNSVKYSYNKKIIYKCDFPHALTYMCTGNQCENNFTDNGGSWGRQDNSVVGCLSEDYEVCGSSLSNCILLQSSSLTSSCCLLILPSCD